MSCKFRNLNSILVRTVLPNFSLEIEVSDLVQATDFELLCGGLRRSIPETANFAIIDERSKSRQIKCQIYNSNVEKDYPENWFNVFLAPNIDGNLAPSAMGAPSDAFSINLATPCTIPFSGWYGFAGPDGLPTGNFFETYPNNPSRLRAFTAAGTYVGDGSFTFEYA